jgi:hypothetical protein
MYDLVGHGNTGGSSDGENGDSNNFGYNHNGDNNFASVEDLTSALACTATIIDMLTVF